MTAARDEIEASIDNIVSNGARRRGLEEGVWRYGDDPYAGLPHPADLAVAQPTATGTDAGNYTDQLVAGGQFLLDVPETTPAVWGEGSDVLWAEGESLIIAAGNGAGKTTLAGQLVHARLGLSKTVLGLPVAPGAKRVLYLAMDRPQQIARALNRRFDESEREHLDQHLTFWPGPPPADLARHPETLRAMIQAADADTVIVDSLKDAAIGLSDDEVGAGWNRARQYAVAAGCQVLELHHNVKRNANGGEPSTIADVYGSAWITAGVGSVILLLGAPGDPVVSMRHVKQPAEEVGPWRLLHDHVRGITGLYETATPLEIVQRLGTVTAKQAAEIMFDTDKASPAQKMKAVRKLDDLTKKGFLTATHGDNTTPTTYRIAAPAALFTDPE